MKFRFAAVLLGTATLLSACDGDSRPFSEAVEVSTLNLVGVTVLAPVNSVPDIFLNISQGVQLRVGGIIPDVVEPTILSANGRSWSVSDPTIASITQNGYLRALANGPVDVSLSLGGLDSVAFGITVADETLTTITNINSVSGDTTLEQCLPQEYFATGTFSDGTTRNLENLTWTVNNPTAARLFETSGTSTKLNALSALDQLTLTASAPDGEFLDHPLIVSDSLQSIAILPSLISLDVGEEDSLSASGLYTINSGTTTEQNRQIPITSNVDWTVVTGTNNLSVSNVRGTKGLITGLVAGNAEIIAACGARGDRKPVVISAADSSTELAFKIGEQLVSGGSLTLSRANFLAPIPILASTGTEYDSDNDVTSTVDFQRQDSITTLTPPFVIDGNGTSAPTIRLTATGTATIVATETTDGVAVETLTITVTN
ncbi:hypothetical protein N9850_02810 [Granulosicoccus sp.]|jgi:hypothetical protein|nr:hypothetical protein [Granulosicoccus sp.]MDB4222677.1 hypothetical protein [Granulosicoccus sp.]